MMHKPFDYAKLVSLGQFQEALSDIKNDIDAVQELIAKAELTQDPLAHMRCAMAMSGLEIKMTNFAKHMRERFV